MLTCEQIVEQCKGLRVNQGTYSQVAENIHPRTFQYRLPDMSFLERVELLKPTGSFPEVKEAMRGEKWHTPEDWTDMVVNVVTMWQERARMNAYFEDVYATTH